MKIFVRNKRGSLSLSMEAIVILILAVVMLGLGLAFVRNMFGNIEDKAEKALDVADLEAKPSESDPVVFSPNSPSGKEGKEIQVKVGFFNPSTDETKYIMTVTDGFTDPCGGLDPGSDTPCHSTLTTIYNPNEFSLQKDQTIGWNIIVVPESGSVPESTKPFLLTVKFTGQTGTDPEVYQKEMFLTVRR